VRWTFPAGAAVVAGYLALRGRAGPYLAFCCWLFLLTPFLRRVDDLHAGFSPGSVLMLAPYLATGWSVLRLPAYFMNRQSPLQVPVAMVLLCLAYGFLLAVLGGRLLPGAIDLLRWVCPLLFAVYIMSHAERWDELCAALRATSLVALPLVGLYGLWQFVSPPLWDIIWMLNAKITSIGVPRPFEIRVFSTLNSPGSLAFWLMGLMLVAMTVKTPLRWMGIALGAGALAVSLIRSVWVGLLLALTMVAIRGGAKMRLAIIGAVAVTMFATPFVLTNPHAEVVVSKRLETLFNIGGDVSYTQRASGYSAFRDEMMQNPWGEGLGIGNVAGNYAESARNIDGGPIEIMLAFGLVFGSLYIGAIAIVLVAVLLRTPPPRDRDLFVAGGAIVTVQALELSSLMTVGGEIGVVFWLAAALVMAAPRKLSHGTSPHESFVIKSRGPILAESFVDYIRVSGNYGEVRFEKGESLTH
jgi:hypothetical protein